MKSRFNNKRRVVVSILNIGMFLAAIALLLVATIQCSKERTIVENLGEKPADGGRPPNQDAGNPNPSQITSKPVDDYPVPGDTIVNITSSSGLTAKTVM